MPFIDIGEEEIDVVIAQIDATKDAAQYRLSELILPVDDRDDIAEVRELAVRLVTQIRGGADFGAVARQFSKSATAAIGGDIGWVQEGQVESSIIQILEVLEEGELSDPIQTEDGFLIYRLDAKRQNTAPGKDDQEIALRQIVVPVDRGASDAEAGDSVAQVKLATQEAQSCEDFVASAETLGVRQSAKPTRIRVGDLNEKLQDIVSGLATGQSSEPVRTAVGVQVIMVCERSELGGPPRDEIRDALLRQKVDLRARRYLRDLRRAAFVDLRV